MGTSPIWKLLAESGLVPPDKCQELAEEFQRQQPPQALINDQTSAAWLVSQGVVSSYQATVLQAGHAGPFDYADYRVDDRSSSGPRKGSFRGQHRPTHQRVALRFVDARTTAEQWQSVQQRVARRQAIAHPCLTRTFEAVTLPQYRFVVVNEFPQETLSEYLHRKQRLSVKRACLITHQLASALAAAHQAGEVHGELQADQVQIDESGHVELWWEPTRDFRHHARQRAEMNPPAALQAAAYWAPELADPNQQPTPASDLYALGCLFYQMLTGHLPFSAASLDELLEKHAREPIQSLQNLDVPAPVEKLVTYLMAKNVEVRYSSAEQVVAKFEKLLKSSKSGKPPQLPPVPAGESAFCEWLKEHRPPQSSAAAVPSTAAGATSAGSPSAASASEGFSEMGVGETSFSVPGIVPETGLANPSVTPGQAFIQADEDHRLARARQRPRKTTRPRWGMALAAAVLLIGSVAALWSLFVAPNNRGNEIAEQEQSEKSSAAAATPPSQDVSQPTNVAFQQEVVDSGAESLLWETPTQGPPLQLDYLPGGLRLLIAIRPAELLAKEEGVRLRAALGPAFVAWTEELEQLLGSPLSSIKQLVIGFHDNQGERPRVSYRVLLTEPQSLAKLAEEWGAPAEDDTQQRRRFTGTVGGRDVLAWSIQDEATRHFLIASPEDITAVSEIAGAPPLLRLELKQLLRYSDRRRHLSLLAIPTSLFNDEGRQLFQGELEPLLEPLENLLADGIAAAAASLHLDQDLYLEMMLKATLDVEPLRLVELLEERINQELAQSSMQVFTLGRNRYWDQLRMRFSNWMNLIQTNTRYGVEQQIAMANCWLPQPAAHNVALASELALASSGAGGSLGTNVPPAKQGPSSLDELLDTRFDLEIPRNDLVLIVEELKDTIRNEYPSLPFPFDIKMLGNDLQLEGITQNQSVSDFKMVDAPLSEILTELMKRAFKAPGVESPRDPGWMLIWALGPDPDQGGPPIILVTTRKAAQREGYKIPDAFQPAD